MESKVYHLRKGILLAFKFYGHDMPCNVGDIASYSRVSVLRLSEPAIADQLQELAGMEFVESCPGFDGGFYKITRKGLEAISPEFPEPPFISGRPG